MLDRELGFEYGLKDEIVLSWDADSYVTSDLSFVRSLTIDGVVVNVVLLQVLEHVANLIIIDDECMILVLNRV